MVGINEETYLGTQLYISLLFTPLIYPYSSSLPLEIFFFFFRTIPSHPDKKTLAFIHEIQGGYEYPLSSPFHTMISDRSVHAMELIRRFSKHIFDAISMLHLLC